MSQRKPFTPYLGETFTSYFRDGTILYTEHISYDPMITNFLMVNDKEKWRMYGFFIHGVQVGANSFTLEYKGPVNIEFSDKTIITCYFPNFKSDGVMFGDRNAYFENKLCCEYKDFQ